MHRLVPKSANLRDSKLKNSRIMTYTALALLFATGCGNPAPAVRLSWDFSKSRNVSCLSHGEWLGPNDFIYHINGSRKFHLSIVLDGGRTFDFDGARNIYVQQETSRISSIRIVGYGYTQQGAIDRVIEMHSDWKGENIGHTEKWLADTKKGSLRNHISTVQSSENAEEPEIWTTILYNFGNKNNEWCIMTTFFWSADKLRKNDAGKQRSDTIFNENSESGTE